MIRQLKYYCEFLELSCVLFILIIRIFRSPLNNSAICVIRACDSNFLSALYEYRTVRGPATRYFSVPILATILIFHDQLRKRGTENSVKIDLEQGAERNRCLMAMARSMKKQKSC